MADLAHNAAGTASSISLPDVLGLVSLCLGVVALVLGIVLPLSNASNRRAIGRLRGTVEQFEHAVRQHEILMAGLRDFTTAISAKSEFQNGLLHRALDRSGGATDLPGLRAEFVSLDRDVNKGLQEVMLLHPDSTVRRSAILQLSQSCGDRESLAQIQSVAQLAAGDEDLREGIKILEARLAADNV